MKSVVVTGFIMSMLILLNLLFQINEYNDRKALVIRTHLEMEMNIVKGIARSAESWFRYNILNLKRNKVLVEDEVFRYFVDPVLLFKNGDAWIYNRGYAIYDKSGDFPDIYRGKSIDKIFEIQKYLGASHYDGLVNGVLNSTEGKGWYIWLPEKGREWVAWTSVKAGEDSWTIGLSTPEGEIFEYYNMEKYRRRIIINSFIITLLFLVIFGIIFRMRWNDILNEKIILQEKKAAEDANRTKSRFLANISHEIRTPINNIMGMTYLLAGTETDSQQKEYIEMIESSSDNLMETINQLLDISKIEAGKFEIENETFNLVNTVNIVSRIFTVNAQKKNLEFIYHNEIGEDSSIVFGDQRILKHILNNLLGNAIKYTESGYIRLSLQTSSSPVEGITAVFEVEDSGTGISDDNIHRIFDYFYRINPDISGDKSGTGLGLTIVRDLIDLSDGEIDVSSKPGSGSCFRVKLKYKSPPLEVFSGSDEIHNDSEFNNSKMIFRKLTVLVAEDDRVSSLFIKNILNRISCDTVNVMNGEEVIASVESADYDILIIDGEMPVMNGIETIRQIRKMEKEKNLRRNRIVAISAFAMEEEKEKFLNAGADEYLSKPIIPDRLFSIIKKLSADIV